MPPAVGGPPVAEPSLLPSEAVEEEVEGGAWGSLPADPLRPKLQMGGEPPLCSSWAWSWLPPPLPAVSPSAGGGFGFGFGGGRGLVVGAVWGGVRGAFVCLCACVHVAWRRVLLLTAMIGSFDPAPQPP